MHIIHVDEEEAPSTRLQVPESPAQVGQEKHTTHNPSSSQSSDPTIASMRRHKTRSLKEIYDKSNEVDQGALFAFLTCQPENFEEEVKEKE